MTNEDFERTYLPRYRGVIKALARKLARRDQELYEDLCQVGMIALWQLDPTKATQNEDAFVRQILFNKMTDVLRRDRPALYQSLTALMARGDQLTLDQAGDVRLIYAVDAPRESFFERMDEDEEG